MLDPFIEIVLDGIRAKKEEPRFTLYLKNEDARAMARFLEGKEDAQRKMSKGALKLPQTKKPH
jgi:mono/diheme cytochrome c family protein